MKTTIGGVNALYPSLTVVAGALVQGRPNFITIAHVGIMNHGTPSLISLSMGKAHHTNQGIHEQGTFSVNIPSREQMAVTDYVGLVSGRNTDKSGLFDIFYGELQTAPMIVDFPVSMECRLERVVDFASHDLFVGEIVQTYVSNEVLHEGKVDIARVDPLLFDFQSVHYWGLGEKLGPCWRVGKELKQES